MKYFYFFNIKSWTQSQGNKVTLAPTSAVHTLGEESNKRNEQKTSLTQRKDRLWWLYLNESPPGTSPHHFRWFSVSLWLGSLQCHVCITHPTTAPPPTQTHSPNLCRASAPAPAEISPVAIVLMTLCISGYNHAKVALNYFILNSRVGLILYRSWVSVYFQHVYYLLKQRWKN